VIGETRVSGGSLDGRVICVYGLVLMGLISLNFTSILQQPPEGIAFITVGLKLGGPVHVSRGIVQIGVESPARCQGIEDNLTVGLRV
jgi:hypothetical protein